jgi:hypothetical protein
VLIRSCAPLLCEAVEHQRRDQRQPKRQHAEDHSRTNVQYIRAFEHAECGPSQPNCYEQPRERRRANIKDFPETEKAPAKEPTGEHSTEDESDTNQENRLDGTPLLTSRGGDVAER